MVDIETPSGEIAAIDDPPDPHARRPDRQARISLVRSDRALWVSSRVALLRANRAAAWGGTRHGRRSATVPGQCLCDLSSAGGFGEDGLVGHTAYSDRKW